MGRLDLARDCTIVLSSKGHAWATAAFQIELVRMGEARVRTRNAVPCLAALVGLCSLPLSPASLLSRRYAPTCMQHRFAACIGAQQFNSEAQVMGTDCMSAHAQSPIWLAQGV